MEEDFQVPIKPPSNKKKLEIVCAVPSLSPPLHPFTFVVRIAWRTGRYSLRLRMCGLNATR